MEMESSCMSFLLCKGALAKACEETQVIDHVEEAQHEFQGAPPSGAPLFLVAQSTEEPIEEIPKDGVWQVFSHGGWRDCPNDEAKAIESVRKTHGGTVMVRGQRYQMNITGHPKTWVRLQLRTGKRHAIRFYTERHNSSNVTGMPHKSNNGQDGTGSLTFANLANVSMARQRCFAWRGAEWHPMGRGIEDQINVELRKNETIFDVADGSKEFRVDTTAKGGWTMVNKQTAELQKMKNSEDVHRDCLSEPETVVQQMMSEWKAVSAGQQFILKQDIDRLVRSQMGAVHPEDAELVKQSIDFFFKMADVERAGQLDAAAWYHYRLLRDYAPSCHSFEELNELLLAPLKVDRTMLKRMQDLFLKCCQDRRSDARITRQELEVIHQAWTAATGSDHIQSTASSVENDKIEKEGEAAEEAAQKKAEEHFRWQSQQRTCCAQVPSFTHFVDMIFAVPARPGQYRPPMKPAKAGTATPRVDTTHDHEDGFSYYDFLNSMLGRKQAPVHINIYDISDGKVQWLAPILLGRKVEGLWHTGLVIHGREYWFGGSIFESIPGKTPFGEPTKVRLIGSTMRTRQEIWNHIDKDLFSEYTSENYDVLTHNCNHFSNALCHFVLNEDIPGDVLHQPEQLMNTWSAKLMRPLLNHALGRFEKKDGDPAHHRGTSDAVAKQTWEKLTPGSLVVYEYSHGWSILARILSKSNQGTCDLRWLDVEKGNAHQKYGVSRLEVHPYDSGLTAAQELEKQWA
eukprot:TRINITY_DN112472_c0_g1_i1.p1 TRINITY_DN112472_c0_g1~~TRINITY_DN112472_c0_g1_i1.p1  ORF type:complete len:740 (+),score=167.96 TRINITY_DN112472_c0_g1_i1:130-2349(+)